MEIEVVDSNFSSIYLSELGGIICSFNHERTACNIDSLESVYLD